MNRKMEFYIRDFHAEKTIQYKEIKKTWTYLLNNEIFLTTIISKRIIQGKF